MKQNYQLLFSAGLFLTTALTGQNDSNFPLIARSPESIDSTMTINSASGITKENYKLGLDYVSNTVITELGHTYTGSKKGIDLWDKYTHIEITTDNSHIPDNHITALALDKDNKMWIGTYNSGIVIGIGRDIKPFKVRPVVTQEKCISSISNDNNGLMWVIYRTGGMECFKNCISCAYFSN